MAADHTLELLRAIRATQTDHSDAFVSVQMALQSLAMNDQARHADVVRANGDVAALTRRIEQLERRLELIG